MKTSITCIFLITATLVLAQTQDYPTAPPITTLKAAEFFIATDPGFGKATPIALPPQANISDFSAGLNIASLPPGIYSIGFRTQDAGNRWSHTRILPFFKFDLPAYPVSSLAPPMAAAEYFITHDPGLGKAKPLSLPALADPGPQNLIADISGAGTGIFVTGWRTKDANGQWSLTHFRTVNNQSAANYPTAPPAAGPIQQLEYFIDEDPGFGLANTIPITPGLNITDLNASINLSGLSDGPHTLCIRSRSNPWSLTTFAEFLIGTPLPLQWLFVRGEMRTNGAHLSWGTSTEKNTKHFEVEHSITGMHFSNIATLPAAGNSSVARDYGYLHIKAAPGLNYYRIKQVDTDGAFTYSKTITVLNRSTLHTAIMAPNPATSQALLILPHALEANGVVQVVDVAGKQVLNSLISKGAWQATLDVEKLPAGIYRVVLQSSGYKVTLPLVKQ